jgi:hypothetical protein
VNTALWIVAGVLSVVFAVAGSSKLFVSRERLARAPGGGWVFDFSGGFVKGLGAVELAGVAGLILPVLLGVAPVLTPLAALGLASVMVGAVAVEYRRGELEHVALDLAYLALAAFVAFGRLFAG